MFATSSCENAAISFAVSVSQSGHMYQSKFIFYAKLTFYVGRKIFLNN
jgi:hypothetical protein